MLFCSLQSVPVLDEDVACGVVGVVRGRGHAGFNKQTSVGEGGGGLDPHIDGICQIHLKPHGNINYVSVLILHHTA